jgi:hypothetical protein
MMTPEGKAEAKAKALKASIYAACVAWQDVWAGSDYGDGPTQGDKATHTEAMEAAYRAFIEKAGPK